MQNNNKNLSNPFVVFFSSSVSSLFCCHIESWNSTHCLTGFIEERCISSWSNPSVTSALSSEKGRNKLLLPLCPCLPLFRPGAGIQVLENIWNSKIIGKKALFNRKMKSLTKSIVCPLGFQFMLKWLFQARFWHFSMEVWFLHLVDFLLGPGSGQSLSLGLFSTFSQFESGMHVCFTF